MNVHFKKEARKEEGREGVVLFFEGPPAFEGDCVIGSNGTITGNQPNAVFLKL